MLKKILIFSVSLCLFAGTAHAGSLPKQNKQQIKQTTKEQTKNKLTKKLGFVRYARLFSVELNYNTLSVTLSYMPAYKFSVSGRIAKVVVHNVKTNLKSKPVILPVINSNSIKRADYKSNKHNLIIYCTHLSRPIFYFITSFF